MNEKAIRDRLVEHGQTLFRAPKQFIQFTRLPGADDPLNALAIHPHAFVLACVMDRQIKAEKAWLIPYRIAKKLGGFSMDNLCQLSLSDSGANFNVKVMNAAYFAGASPESSIFPRRYTTRFNNLPGVSQNLQKTFYFC